MKEAKLDSGVLGKARPRPAADEGVISGIRFWPKRAKAFLSDVRSETKRVSWPSFTQIRATTIVVIFTVFFFGVYFGILDWIFNHVVRRLLRFGS
ncbi:MAG: preprotein translocase subunit SecE [Acidobacteria bacterium]|nr:preprotein translocase subunit SecE [Acidobacteriota bacterium]